MSKSVKILGKKALPIWLLVVVLVACGAGAAAGTVLAGKVTGEVPVAVSQALLVNPPIWQDGLSENPGQPQQVRTHVGYVALPNRYIGTVADDNTAFEAAAELAVGDWAAFNLPLKNASENDLIALVTLSVPECLEVEVYSANTSANIPSVVRIGLNTWKVQVNADAEYDATDDDCLMFVISVDDTCAPGYYTITGVLKQIAY